MWGRVPSAGVDKGKRARTRDTNTNEAGEESEPLVASAPLQRLAMRLLPNNQPPPSWLTATTARLQTARPDRSDSAIELGNGPRVAALALFRSWTRPLDRSNDTGAGAMMMFGGTTHTHTQQLDASCSPPTNPPTHTTLHRTRQSGRGATAGALDRPKPDVAFHRRPGPPGPGRRHDGTRVPTSCPPDGLMPCHDGHIQQDGRPTHITTPPHTTPQDENLYPTGTAHGGPPTLHKPAAGSGGGSGSGGAMTPGNGAKAAARKALGLLGSGNSMLEDQARIKQQGGGGGGKDVGGRCVWVYSLYSASRMPCRCINEAFDIRIITPPT